MATDIDALEFGHVIKVNDDLTFEDYGTTEQGISADSIIYIDLDENGGAPEPNLFGSGYSDGWQFLTGWTGQYGYNGAIMHPSEYIGGNLADHILSTPGLWVSVIIDAYPSDEDAESENVGWALLHYNGDDI